MPPTILSAIQEDWATLFQQTAQKNRIPNTDVKRLAASRCVIRAAVVDLKQTLDEIAAQSLTPSVVFIYADVVTVPAAYQFTLSNCVLIITTRLIEIKDTAQASLVRNGPVNPQILVFAAELQGEMKVEGATQSLLLGPLEPNAIGLNIVLQEAGLSRNPVAKLQTPMLTAGSDFYLALTSSFQFATALFETRPEIAERILQWIIRTTSQSPDFSRLFLQASSLAVLLRVNNAPTPYVPELSQTFYRQETNIYLSAAVAYEESYTRFVDQKATLADRQAAAQIMLAKIEDNIGYTKRVIEQVKENLNSVSNAVSATQKSFAQQKSVVERAKVRLQAGIDTFSSEKRAELAFKIIGAIVEVAAAIGEVALGDVEAPVEEVAELAKVAEDIAAAMIVLQEVLTVLAKLIQLGDTIQGAVQSANSGTIAAIGNTLDALVSPEDKEQPADARQALTAWDEFRVQADNGLAAAVTLGIDGATEYKTAMDVFSIRGKALAENQLASVALVQELVRLSLQLQAAVNQQARMKEYIAGLSPQTELNAELLQMAHDRYLDVKRSLFAALLNYRYAFKYWGLQDSRLQPSIVRDVADVRNDLQSVITDLHLDYQTALGKLKPIPQRLAVIEVIINDRDTLTTLQANKTASWAIPINAPQFAGFDRVRIEEVSIFLDGAARRGQPIYISIASSGNYADKFRGQALAFVGPPIDKAFQYIPEPLKINVQGKVVEELQYAFFVPTPFTTWTITLPDSPNHDLDLSGLTQIRMQFAGSVMKGTN